MASFSEELNVAGELASRDAANMSARRNLASAQTRLAFLSADDLPRALALIDEAERTLRDIVRADARPVWRRDLAATIQRQAALRRLAGDQQRAAAAAREALTIIESLAASESGNPQTTRVLCEVLLFAADMLPPEAEEAVRLRTRVTALAMTVDGREPRVAVLRARALMGLGRRSEAEPLMAALSRAGYRDLDPVIRR
jgi:hypothetical protein